jgi:hypothetical protein
MACGADRVRTPSRFTAQVIAAIASAKNAGHGSILLHIKTANTVRIGLLLLKAVEPPHGCIEGSAYCCSGTHDDVAGNGRIPFKRADMRARIGVEQELIWIEAMTRIRLMRSVDAKAVACAGPDTRDASVRNLVGELR